MADTDYVGKKFYPKYVTHATKDPCVVDTLEAHQALGPGWGLDDSKEPVKKKAKADV